MNRIEEIVQRLHGQSPSDEAPSHEAPRGELLAEASAAVSQWVGQHCLFSPLHYEKKYAYPLLVWLHSARDDERQLQRIMPLLSMRNYAAVGPRGVAAAENGYGWPTEFADDADQAVFDAIELAERSLHIARRRVFLAGCGEGGTMAFRVALRHPDRFAGVLSASGPFPDGGAPLASLNAARKMPLFIAHGRDGKRYSQDQVCDELRLYHAAGLDVTLRQYPCGDDLTTQMLHDMNVWMMEIVTGQRALSGGDI